MNTRIRARALAVLLTLATLPVHTAVAAQDPDTLKDLTAVIALLGMPCGRVTAAQPLASNEHLASCDNGMRYRVFVDAQGRVTAARQ